MITVIVNDEESVPTQILAAADVVILDGRLIKSRYAEVPVFTAVRPAEPSGPWKCALCNREITRLRFRRTSTQEPICKPCVLGHH